MGRNPALERLVQWRNSCTEERSDPTGRVPGNGGGIYRKSGCGWLEALIPHLISTSVGLLRQVQKATGASAFQT